MNIFRRIFLSRKTAQSQADNPNRAVLTLMRHLGFRETAIRKALVELNEVNVRRLANGVGVPTLYGALKGANQNPKAREILAGALSLSVTELFEERVEGRG